MKSFSEHDFAAFAGLAEAGLLNWVDLYFARLVCRRAGTEGDYALFLAALLAGHGVNAKRQVCFLLRDLPADCKSWLLNGGGEDERALDEEQRRFLDRLTWPEEWEERLLRHPAVASPTEAAKRRHFLVLDEGRLYLQRYWEYEQELARQIFLRLADTTATVCDHLPRLADFAPRFAGLGDGERLQAAAVLAGLSSRFTIISGGPGTGKTSVVAAIAAGILQLVPETRIALCAPTGLAQARLQQALLEEVEHLVVEADLRERLRRLEAATIHRLLGYVPGRGFRFHAGRRLAADLLIVDEASMVPLWIMSSLLAALPESCRVILLGDRHQLASVEAGAVLGDLCRSAAGNCFSPRFTAALESFCGQPPDRGRPPEKERRPGKLLRDCVVELKKSHRFAPDGGIARLQRAILGAEKDGGKALTRFLEGDDPSGEVRLRTLPAAGPELEAFYLAELAAQEVLVDGQSVSLRELGRIRKPDRAFSLLRAFRLLAPQRHGFFGVGYLNRILPRALDLDDSRPYYPGRLLMVVRNAPAIRLFNGDVGIVLEDEQGDPQVCFADGRKPFRSFSPYRLPPHESAFAVTVHKAQGSGFQKVILVWPDRDSPLLTREMLYTAVTRAARRIEIWLPESSGIESLVTAARRSVQRPGGLSASLEKLEATIQPNTEAGAAFLR